VRKICSHIEIESWTTKGPTQVVISSQGNRISGLFKAKEVLEIIKPGLEEIYQRGAKK